MEIRNNLHLQKVIEMKFGYFCLKKLGKTDHARSFFEQVIAENHKAYYFARRKAEVNLIRFYQALAFKELGREAEANMVLAGVNNYRRLSGLIPLKFSIEDEKLWNTKDPDIKAAGIPEGPEI